MTAISKYWSGIEAQLDRLGCGEELRLRSGASDSALDELEGHIDQSLPDSVREFLKRHDGQEDGAASGLFYGQEFLSIDGIRTQWDSWRGLEGMNESMTDVMRSIPPGHIQPLYTSERWIPLTHDWGGNHVGLDYDPDDEGTAGQVITFGRDEEVKRVLAKRFEAFVAGFETSLRTATWNGEYLEHPDTAQPLREFTA